MGRRINFKLVATGRFDVSLCWLGLRLGRVLTLTFVCFGEGGRFIQVGNDLFWKCSLVFRLVLIL